MNSKEVAKRLRAWRRKAQKSERIASYPNNHYWKGQVDAFKIALSEIKSLEATQHEGVEE